MKSKSVLIAVLVVAFVAVAGGSFWLGTYYQEQSRMNQMRQFAAGSSQGQPPGMSGRNQQGMPGSNQQGPMEMTGKVDKVDSNSITITARFGSQKITFPSNVTVSKPSSGSIDDIKQGTQIMVQGKRDSDGKIQAKTIQIISK